MRFPCLPFAPDATTLQHYVYSADRQELNRITKTLNVTPFRATEQVYLVNWPVDAKV